MPERPSLKQQSVPLYGSSIEHKKPLRNPILLVVYCIALFLSGCANSLVTTPQHAPSPTAHAKPTIQASLSPKSDASGIQTEEILRKQLMEVSRIMQGMSLDQKLGQLIMVEYLGNSYETNGLQTMITQQFVGGFMYQESNHNFDSPYNRAGNVKAFSQQAMSDAAIPLLIATDQEGGLVNRLYKFHGYLPSAASMAAGGDPKVALDQGSQAAQWLLDLGINADLAPVVDVHTVDPPILESRMFGSDPNTVATYASAFLKGLQANGVAGCLKHFPGLGAISSDPHAGLPTVSRSKADLEKIDLAPYKLMIHADNPAMIMSTDVLMPALDPNLPAELSPAIINGVLRQELGYDGVVITDGLYMQGISKTWSLGEAAVLSIIAGNDLIEGPYTPASVANVIVALKQAIQQNRLSIDRIDQSVRRILLMKVQYGIIK